MHSTSNSINTVPGKATKRLAITLGCTCGIGPEIALRLAHRHAERSLEALEEVTLRFYGDLSHTQVLAQRWGWPSIQELAQRARGRLEWRNTRRSEQDTVGTLSYIAVEQAVQDIVKGECDGVVTGPVSKTEWQAAGIPYSGHTEALQALANRWYPNDAGQCTFWQADMLFQHQAFTLLLLTRHIPLRDISQQLNLDQAIDSIQNLIHYMSKDHTNPLRLALLGVNPHAGEIGGTEEKMVLQPLKHQIESVYPHVSISGPLAADAFFRGFDAQTAKGFDAVISPYHDQGLIPMKLLGGHHAVNITIGLPFLRTSVSHGTAEDIAGQGIADARSLEHATLVLNARL
jgi:4-hydroxythreonine-4-phosphate dehydrogenase